MNLKKGITAEGYSLGVSLRRRSILSWSNESIYAFASRTLAPEIEGDERLGIGHPGAV